MASGKAVNVVILCGGFSHDLRDEILVDTNNAAQQADGTVSGLKRTVLLGSTGDERVNPALAPVFAKKNVEYILRSLEGVKRLQPLNQHVFFVINDCDKPMFVSEEGSLFAECSDLGFSVSRNVICNGARKASEWRGQLGDLAAALPVVGSASPLVAMTGGVSLLPGFNMQRVIEHSLVRNLDTVAYSALNRTDCVLLNAAGAARLHTIAPADGTSVVPPLVSVSVAGAPTPGLLAAEQLLVLKQGTLPKVSGLLEELAAVPGGEPGGPASVLPALAAALLRSGTPVAGVEMGAGRLRLESARALDYADRFMHFFLWHMRPEGDGESDDEAGDADDGRAAETLNAMYGPVLENTAKLAATARDFDKVYFGGEGDTLVRTGDGVLGTTMLKKFKLPSTFYMTTYRRTCADLMR